MQHEVAITLPDLAALPPGPQLAAALAQIDLDQVAAEDTVEVLQAWHRHHAHAEAQLYAAMVAVGHADRRNWRSPKRLPAPDARWSDEIRAALCWTRRAAERACDVAAGLAELPALWGALDQGRIDAAKARVFVDHVTGLEHRQAVYVCKLVLPNAPGWTTSQIGRRLRELILEIDPGHYERRMRTAIVQRRVRGWVTEDGSATLHATGIRPDDGDAALERIDQLARVVRRGGHPGTLDQIRVDLFVGFLDGSLHGRTAEEITDILIAEAAARQAETAAQTEAAAQPEPPARADAAAQAVAPAHAESAATDPGTDTTGRAQAAGQAKADASPVSNDTGPAEAAAGRSETRAVDQDARGVRRAETADVRAETPGADQVPDATSRMMPVERPGSHVQISLATLLGRDERPARIPALGPLPAPLARTIVARQTRAPWRFAITDPEGRLIRSGPLRSRPAWPGTAGASSRQRVDPAAPGLVDLIIDAALLEQLSRRGSDLPAAWRKVITEIVEAEGRGRALDDAPQARFPHAGLRRHVELRDQTCTFITCLVPARRADLDHTRDHAKGGTTTNDDLGPACRHDHGLKEHGWRVEQPRPGHFVWTSPLGRIYRTRAQPLLRPPVTPMPGRPDTELDRPHEPFPDEEEPLRLYRPPPPRLPPPAPRMEEPPEDPEF